MGRGEIVVRKVRPGLDEALRVERHTGFPCELTRTKSGDKLFVGPRRANNLQTPRSDDEATRILCACFDKDVANLNRMDGGHGWLHVRSVPVSVSGTSVPQPRPYLSIGLAERDETFLIIITRSEDALPPPFKTAIQKHGMKF